MQETIDQFIEFLAQKQRSANTRESYRHDLESCAEYFRASGIMSWQAVDQYAVLNLLAKMKEEQRATTTINRTISSLRQLYRFLLRRHQVQVNPMDYIDREQVATPKDPVVLTTVEIERLLAVPDTSTLTGLRDRALIELMYGTGMLVSELINLKRSQVHFDLQILQLQDSPQHQRIVPLGRAASQWLAKYLDATAGQAGVYVFLNAHGHQMTRQGIWKSLKAIVAQAKIEKNVTPQTLRHTFTAVLLNNGASWQVVQALLGRETGKNSFGPYVQFSTQQLVEMYHQYHPRA